MTENNFIKRAEVITIPRDPEHESMGVLGNLDYDRALTSLRKLVSDNDPRMFSMATSLKLLAPENFPQKMGISVLYKKAIVLAKPVIEGGKKPPIDISAPRMFDISEDEQRLKLMADCMILFGSNSPQINAESLGINSRSIETVSTKAMKNRTGRQLLHLGRQSNLTSSTYPLVIADFAHLALLNRNLPQKFGLGEMNAFIEDIVQTDIHLLNKYGIDTSDNFLSVNWEDIIQRMGQYTVIDPRLGEHILPGVGMVEDIRSALRNNINSADIRRVIKSTDTAALLKFPTALPHYAFSQDSLKQQIVFNPPFGTEFPQSVVRY